jgi:molecular chaperone GrpE
MSEETPLDRPELEEKLSELEILRQSLEASKEKQKDVFDQLLRLGAEFENFRKRSEVRVRDSRTAGKEEMLLPILSLSDALAQADSSAQSATDIESLRKGVTLLRLQFDKFLMEQGLSAIKAAGEKFDPQQHEAIAQEVSAEKDE